MFFATTASGIALLRDSKACVELDLIRKVEAQTPLSPTTKTKLLSRYTANPPELN